MAPRFAYDVAVLRITVAALMTTEWIARFLAVPEGTDLVVLPGLCEGDVGAVEGKFGVRTVKGPKDLREIPELFGGRVAERDYGAHSIEIVAEINNAPRLAREAVRARAEYYRAAGADWIDIGCTPGLPYPELGDTVRELVALGMAVSVDSLDPAEIRAAVEAGARLVLSVNGSNLDVAPALAGTGARVVVIPDTGAGIETLDPTVERLEALGVPYLLDPIVEPIGFGFMRSLERYAEVRRRYPQAPMMMGIGNITELTAADTTGVNALLIAVCQELGVTAVLTTEVDVARRLMHYAVANNVVPKRIDDRLVTVKDAKILAYTEEELRALQARITDPNFRIFADGSTITVFNDALFVRGTDIQAIFDQLGVTEGTHAFYLGKELARAKLSIDLGKTYRQEGSLNWGYLTPADDVKSEHVKLTQRRRSRREGRRAEPAPEGGGATEE